MKAFLWVNLPLEFFGKQTIPRTCPSLLNSPLEPIGLSPCIRSPILRIIPASLVPLIASQEQEFSQHILRLDVPGSGEQAIATHRLEILFQFPELPIIRRNCRNEGFHGNMREDLHIFLPSLSHLSSLLSFPYLLQRSFLSPTNHYGVLANALPITRKCKAPVVQRLVARNRLVKSQQSDCW